MRALNLGDGQPRVTLVPDPEPGAEETCVRVEVAGVCATDLALAAGYMGFRGVPGHEFVGTALNGPLAGQRVVGEINAGCGDCDRCRGGDSRHCASRTVLGILGRPGAFAEQLALPTRNLIPVPDQVPNDRAVFCEPFAAGLASLDPWLEARAAGQVTAKTPALVIGDGRLGLMCAANLALAGARGEGPEQVWLAGRHPARSAALPEGVTHLGVALPDSADGARKALPQSSFVVEATGRAELLPAALATVLPKGMLVLKTTTERPVALDLAPLVVDEIRLVGSRCGRFEPALAELARGQFEPEKYISERFSLERATEALDRAGQPGVLKVLIDIT